MGVPMVNRLLWVSGSEVDDMDKMLMKGQLRIVNAYPMQNAVMFLCEQDESLESEPSNAKVQRGRYSDSAATAC